MWTFKGPSILLAFGLLAGCVGQEMLDKLPLPNSSTAEVGQTISKKDLSTQEKIAGGITVRGPEGYCIINGSKTGGIGRSSVALASCARLIGDDAADETDARILTATSLGAIKGSPRELEALFLSVGGRQKLSVTSNGDRVKIHQSIVTERAVYIEFTDRDLSTHLGQRTWKAAVMVNRNWALLGIFEGSGYAIGGEIGEDFMKNYVAALLSANAIGS